MLNISERVRDRDIVTIEYYTNMDLHVPQGVTLNDIGWSWVTYRNIQWHEASRGLFATAELLYGL